MADARPVVFRPRTVCPHCWYAVEPDETLWVAAHPSLRGDPRLGPDHQLRFLPTRFAPNGAALDEMGAECTQLACPGCHLVFPRLCFEMRMWFVSIVGAPGCGKSYYLASLVHTLRRKLPGRFGISFTDTQAEFNQVVAGYEEQLFANFDPGRSAALNQLVQKTQAQDLALHSSVTVAGQPVLRPRPFLFTLRPPAPKPGETPPAMDPGRILCLYDNAGESFLAGEESAVAPVTQHLAKSSLLLFLFDPTQHPPFRQTLERAGVVLASDLSPNPASRRQHLVLTEMANRTRRHAGLADAALCEKPLVVIVTKKDIWGPRLLPEGGKSPPAVVTSKSGHTLLNLDRIEEQSRQLRQILGESAPEIVAAAEGFATSVTYVGVSALGVQPHQDAGSRAWSVAPKDIAPDGVEVPILFGLNRTVAELIKAGRKQAGTSERWSATTK